MKEIDDIIKENIKVTEKLKKLEKLSEIFEKEIEKAEKDVCKGYTYCEDCKEYYRSDTFKKSKYTEKREICTFRDPTEFGEDRYETKSVLMEANECPMGHKETKAIEILHYL